MRGNWSRVVLKLSGEAFADSAFGYGIDGALVARMAAEVAETQQQLGTEIAIVVGGGNIWRGQTGAGEGMDRANADYNLACFYGRLGDATKAQPLLRASFAARPELIPHARRDPDLDRIRDDPKVKELLAT